MNTFARRKVSKDFVGKIISGNFTPIKAKYIKNN